MSEDLKSLVAKKFENGFSRLYCVDQNGNKYCIQDEGERYAKAYGLPRYTLNTHTKDGEINGPVDYEWDLVKGLNVGEEKTFPVGLASTKSEDKAFEFSRFEFKEHSDTIRMYPQNYCVAVRTDEGSIWLTDCDSAIPDSLARDCFSLIRGNAFVSGNALESILNEKLIVKEKGLEPKTNSR